MLWGLPVITTSVAMPRWGKRQRAAFRTGEHPSSLAIETRPTQVQAGKSRAGCGRIVSLVEEQCGREAIAAPGKPQPDMLVQAASDRGLDLGSVIVVGDSVSSDIGMAIAAGALWALAPEPRTGKEQSFEVASTHNDTGIVLARLTDILAPLRASCLLGESHGARHLG